MSALHPAFVLFITACLAVAARGVLRQGVLLAGTLAALWTTWELGAAASLSWALPNYTLQVLRVDALSHVFGLIFSLITCIGVLYALHVRRGGEHAATLGLCRRRSRRCVRGRLDHPVRLLGTDGGWRRCSWCGLAARRSHRQPDTAICWSTFWAARCCSAAFWFTCCTAAKPA